MKQFFAISFFVFSLARFSAQVQNPLSWTTAYKSISATEGEIIITATIEKNWHTFSQRPTGAGPIPTSLQFIPSPQYQLIGQPVEGNVQEEFVKAFDAKIFVFTDKAEFRQKIKLTGKGSFIVSARVEYMCCNDMMCLPPKTVDVNIKVP